jgi:hypothetical protein
MVIVRYEGRKDNSITDTGAAGFEKAWGRHPGCSAATANSYRADG